MKLPLPLEIVKGRYPIVTQEFGYKGYLDWYKQNGINLDDTGHNGTDIVIGGGKNQAVDTYGCKLICPTNASLENVWFDEPMSTKGNGVKVHWKDTNGRVVKMVVWHCSECVRQNDYKTGDTLGYIGNSGLVSPKPSFYAVHNGAHLHLMAYINDVLTDPREVFDFTKWKVSETDTGVPKDLPPFQYFINKISQSLGMVKTG